MTGESMIRLAGLFFVAGVGAFGLFYSGLAVSFPEWSRFAVVLHAAPLLAWIGGKNALRVSAVWIGVFLIAQALISPLLFEPYFYTLPPALDVELDVVGDALPGISGRHHVTTDKLGFRTTKAIDYENASSNPRIFAIGGSTTEQILLDDRKTWTHLLQEKLGTVEVINTGVAGLRAANHVATLRRIISYHPDMALFLLGGNDWIKHIKETFGSTHYQEQDYREAFVFANSLLGRAYQRLRNMFYGSPPR